MDFPNMAWQREDKVFMFYVKYFIRLVFRISIYNTCHSGGDIRDIRDTVLM